LLFDLPTLRPRDSASTLASTGPSLAAPVNVCSAREELHDELKFLVLKGRSHGLDDPAVAADRHAFSDFERLVEADVAGRDDIFIPAEFVAVVGHRQSRLAAEPDGRLRRGKGVASKVRRALTRCQPRARFGRCGRNGDGGTESLGIVGAWKQLNNEALLVLAKDWDDFADDCFAAGDRDHLWEAREVEGRRRAKSVGLSA
jgi:hypothetical protein